MPEIKNTLSTGATTSTSYPSTSGSVYDWPVLLFTASGTWDGATATVQILPAGHSAWQDVGSDATFTANGNAIVRLAMGDKYRVTVTNAGASTNLIITATRYDGDA